MSSSITKIQDLPFVENLLHFKSIDSTNTFAKNLKDLPRKGITVICADRQTAGRGQRQNSFFSGKAGGIFASVVSPIADISSHFMFNRAISLAIFDALKDTSPKALLAIKWPNDIYWGDKKVCGILLENVPRSEHHIIAGFGINVTITRDTFPDDLHDIATSVVIETGKKRNIYLLLRNILERFWKYLSLDPAAAHLLYSNRLYKVGANCEVNGQTGVFKGVREDGRMRMDVGGNEILLMSGPVRFINNK
jgi:BirA family transcriptional regulator, biotin operon repressor / biotin---[acetyl-CoA-carboxylase] ligase